MIYPLDLLDFASLQLAVWALVLLVTSELLSPHYGITGFKINKNRLKNAALTVSILFLATVAVRIVSILIGP